MRVLLIGQEYEENLSIRYLSSSLRDAGHDVVLSPFNCADDIDSVVCDAFDADLVGLSMCFQVRVPEFLKLARRIKEEYPSRLILAGGHYASCAAEDLLRNHPEIDLIVIHEGEKTIVEIADAGANLHSRLHDIEGIAFRDGSGIHFTTPRHNISDLDLLPFPDRNGPVHMLANVPTAYVLGSRGCLNSCDYCCISTLYKLAPGKKFRQRSIENITDEMAELYHNLGIRQFVFEDDNFLVPSVEMNLKRITALENALHSRGVGEIAFAIKCRPAEVDPVVFVKMKQMGLLRVFLGVESANTCGLSSIGRKQRVEESERALKVCEDLEISSQYTIMIFNPDATVNTIKKDISFTRKHIHHPLCLTRVDALAGTPLEKRIIKSGQAHGNYLGRYYHLIDPIADLACKIAQRTILARYGMNHNLTDLSVGMDHLAEILKYFYCGHDVNVLYDDIHSWCHEVNSNNLDLLEKLLYICTSISKSSRLEIKDAFREFVDEELSSRLRLLSKGQELKNLLEDLTAQMVGLKGNNRLIEKNQTQRVPLARHAAAVTLALALLGGVPTMGVADLPPDEFLEEEFEDDMLLEFYEDEIFNTSPYKTDTDADGVLDSEEDHDSDGITNIDEQDLMLKLLDEVEMGNLENIKILLNEGAYENTINENFETVLMRASMRGNSDIVELLLESGADLELQDRDGMTALMWVAELGRTEVLRTLLNAGADVNAIDMEGKTALIHTTEGVRIEPLHFLLNAGADVNAKDNRGKTALKVAVEKGYAEIVKVLVKAGAEVNEKYNRDRTILMDAAEEGYTEIVEILVKAGAEINEIDTGGSTALMYAVEKDYAEIVEVLLKAGAEMNEKDTHGRTILMDAAERGYAEIVEVIVKAGAEVNIKDSRGRTALMDSAKKGFTEIVDILLDAGAEINKKDTGDKTALMYAAEKGYIEIVEALLNAGAEINEKDIGDKTALMYAAEEDYDEIVKVIVKAGAEVNIKDNRGRTALMVAAEKGYVEIVEILLDAGIEINEKDSRCRTALMYAAEKGHVEVVEILVNAGVEMKLKDIEGSTALEIARMNKQWKCWHLLMKYRSRK